MYPAAILKLISIRSIIFRYQFVATEIDKERSTNRVHYEIWSVKQAPDFTIISSNHIPTLLFPQVPSSAIFFIPIR
jgi:hypothetical protein